MKKKLPYMSQRLSVTAFKYAKKRPIVIVLDNIRSCRNVGAAFRLADAFLLQHIYLCGISPKPPHPQITKTALGAEEVVSWSHVPDNVDIVRRLHNQGYSIIGIELVEGAIPLQELKKDNIKAPWAIVFGHEVFGVDQKVLDEVDVCVEIPQYGTKLSMNVAMCMGIVAWELVRAL